MGFRFGFGWGSYKELLVAPAPLNPVFKLQLSHGEHKVLIGVRHGSPVNSGFGFGV